MSYETTLNCVRSISETAYRIRSPRTLNCAPWQPFTVPMKSVVTSWEDLHPPCYAARPTGRTKHPKRIRRLCPTCGCSPRFCFCNEAAA